MISYLTILPSDAGQRIDRLLKKHCSGVPQSLIERWARQGNLRLDGKRVKVNSRVQEGQTLRIPPFTRQKSQPKLKSVTKKEQNLIKKAIIYQDDNFLVLNKPSGIAVQGGTKVSSSLDDFLEAFKNAEGIKPRIVHRLDKDTSGAIIFARNLETAQWLALAFKKNQIRKIYHAIVVGRPDNSHGIIDTAIAKGSKQRYEQMEITPFRGKKAITHYKVLATSADNLSLLQLSPYTGRTHQLRVHCAHMKWPILGDNKYGQKLAQPFEKREILHLHAYQLTIPLPDGGSRSFKAEISSHMEKTLKKFFSL